MSGNVQHLDPLTFPLTGQALIEASAGTGNTFTLAFLYLRLIIQHGQDKAFHRPLLPPEILVVTFTNAATAELRDRIRARLVEAAAVFQGETTDDALLSALKDQTPQEDHPRAAKQLTMAAQWMDESAISTIHAWCYRMLKEHAFDSGSAFEPNLETNEQEWQQVASEDYWRCEVTPLSIDLLKQVLTCWASPEALFKQVKPCLDKLDYIPSSAGSVFALLTQFNQQQAAFLAQLKSEWQQQGYIAQLQQLFDQEAKRKAFAAKSLNSGHRKSVLDKLQAWLDQPSMLDPNCFTGSSWFRMSSAGVTEIWNDGFEPPIQHAACVALTELKRQLDAMPTLKPQLLAHAAHAIAKRIEQSKKQSNSLSQNDLLLHLDRALSSAQGERLAAAIRKQFPVALVDEFQDTDPVQYRLFRRIYLDGSRQDNVTPLQQRPRQDQRIGFFMIGDPKQAIYAFRGADIYTYLQARRDSEGNHYTLGTNFRSCDGLIQSVNRVFELGDLRDKGAFLFKSASGNPVPFTAVKTGKKELQGLQINGHQVSSLQGWMITQEESKLSKSKTNEALAQATASQIAELLTLGQQGKALLPNENSDQDANNAWRPVQPFDCAVLVNSFTEATLVRRALQRVGIASVYLSDRSSVFRSWMATEMLQLLRATADPLNERKIRTALASPLLRLTIPDLHRLNEDELYWESFAGRFLSYQTVWQKQGVLPLVYRWIQDFNLAEGVGSRDQGERELTDLLHLGELLHQAATSLDGEQALIRYLEEAIVDPDENSEAQQLRLETDAQLVRVVTIHKSKGLEYPLVFLPFIGEARKAKKQDSLFVTHSESAIPQVHLSVSDEVLEQADQERLAEDLRKLYVALTRARYVNWLGLAATDGFNASAMAYLLNASADDLSDKITQLSDLQLLELPRQWPAPWQAEQTSTEFSARSAPKLVYDPWWIASYSALKHNSSYVIESAQQDQLSEEQEKEDQSLARVSIQKTMHTLPKGSHIGTFLHSLLEWAAELVWIDEAGQPQQGYAALLQPELMDQHYDALRLKCQQRNLDEWAPCLWAWLESFVKSTWCFRLNGHRQPSEIVMTEAFSLAHLKPENMCVEMEFWFASHQVNTLTLDQWVSERTLDGIARPALQGNQLNGMLKGFIDLVAEHQGRYYVIDWKSNWLGENETAYSVESMKKVILEKRYDLQYVLYLLALHRYLKCRLPDYDYDQHIGGAAYFFLRGNEADSQGVFFDKPDRIVIEGLDRLFSGQSLQAPMISTQGGLNDH